VRSKEDIDELRNGWETQNEVEVDARVKVAAILNEEVLVPSHDEPPRVLLPREDGTSLIGRRDRIPGRAV